MRRFYRAPAVLLCFSLSCQPTAPTAPVETAAADPWAHLPTDPTSEALVFPPQPSHRERRPLPRHLAGVDEHEEAEIESPELDTDGHFEFSGNTVRIEFNRRVQLKAGTTEPALTIAPAVEGEIDFSSPWLLRFHARESFDPEQKYAVKLGPIEDGKGRPVAEGWEATFRADPQIWLAGKLISYLPTVGKPRVVAVRPWDSTTVGRRPRFEVLFDQPTSLRKAKGLVDIFAKDGKTKIASTLSHPRNDEFEGVEVDRKHVIIARPKRPLGGGAEVILGAHDFGEDPIDGERVAVDVAKPLKFDGVRCREPDSCTLDAGKIELEGRSFAVVFNNSVRMSDKVAAQAIAITPPVPNLKVYTERWARDRIHISGGFAPSTRYRVHVGRVRDVFGFALPKPLDFEVVTGPLKASVSMPEGIQFYDAARSRAFTITTRNVKKANLKLWLVEDNAQAWDAATRRMPERELPDDDPTLQIAIEPSKRRNRFVKTKLDLLSKLQAGRTYLATIELDETAFGATAVEYPEWSMAGKPALALITANDANAMAVHARATPHSTLVHVARLTGGTPLGGAKLFLDGERFEGLTTDRHGLAVLPLSADKTAGKVLRVELDSARAELPLSYRTQSQSDLTPELTGKAGVRTDVRAMMLSDRGVYRPGATMHFKAALRKPEGSELKPIAHMPVRIRVVGPTGKDVFTKKGFSSEMGTFAADFKTPSTAEIGRYQALVEPTLKAGPLATTTTQVAEFEAPRFVVDVETAAPSKRKLEASIAGRYLFGAAMDGANVSWTLNRSRASIPSGPLASRGLTFRSRRRDRVKWSRTGTGTLDDEGRLAVAQALDVESGQGPQRFQLEAEVTDRSNRAIAGRGSVTVHTAERYAGLNLTSSWGDVGKRLPLEVGVVDQTGASVSNATVKVVLERLVWKRTRRPGASGSTRIDWHEVRKRVGSCTAKTAASAVTCDVVPKRAGTYDVTAYVDGKAGGVRRTWIWGDGDVGDIEPNPGHRLALVTDKRRYRAGDTARVVVRSPFQDATAIFTTEQSGILERKTERIKGGSAEFTVAIKGEHAPHVHATVTLLPRGAKGQEAADWKFGAVRLPVSLDDARVAVKVNSSQPHYEPGENADITIKVVRGTEPVAGADVLLAVVDEGVLRLTNFHAPDPVAALRPGVGLRYDIADTRRSMAEMLERSHVAGDGMGGGDQSVVATRKNFVRTALWRPNLRTDENGQASVNFKLPDNLTQFRMMAVVIDETGRGGKAESHFEVRKPLMAIPAVPRFAVVGDSFEAAVMVHSTLEHATSATVALVGAGSKTVDLDPGGRARVAFDIAPKQAGTHKLTFSLLDGMGILRDRVLAELPVQAAGLDERPRLTGSFVGVQEVALDVPAGVFADERGDEFVTVALGNNMWPELGSRLEYLLGYPHGCVEQTTSSTLPLLAARDILPRIGVSHISREQIDTWAEAGIQRLASMRTSTGGLAYWPGGRQPDAYGTSYAMRAVALAHKQGIPVPEGMLEGMREYLKAAMNRGRWHKREEVRTGIAFALAEADGLPESAADMLWDQRDKLGVFGLSSAAIALSTLDGHDEHVSELLNLVEGSFDSDGTLSREGPNDFRYYGSDRRSQSQAALALVRLRPTSTVLPLLIDQLLLDTNAYTTQSTAFSLLALREHIVRAPSKPGEVRALLDGVALVADPNSAEALGPAGVRYRLPVADLQGKHHTLRLESSSDRAVSFMVDARWRRPFDAQSTRVRSSQERGAEVYRFYTDARGEKIELDEIQPGAVVRVGLLARLPVHKIDRNRLGYLALTDRVPAGLEPVQTDLWTVSRVPDIDRSHPLYEHLQWGSTDADHIELRDDRVHVYFDRVYGEFVAATYLLRATTPGTFVVPPAMGELMYEPNSVGYTDATHVTVKR